jgi:hypothetical protein
MAGHANKHRRTSSWTYTRFSNTVAQFYSPSDDKLATWIAAGVWEAKSSLSLESMEKMEKVLKNILGQSGAQFPVCGIKWLDVVRELYKKDRTSSDDEFINACCKANLP